MPFCPKYGIMAVILVTVLPTVGEELSVRNVLTQYMITLMVVSVVDSVTNGAAHRLLRRRLHQYERDTLFGGELRGTTVAAVKSAVILVLLNLLHPFLFTLIRLIPQLLLQVVGLILLGFLALDMVSVVYAGQMRHRGRLLGKKKEAGSDQAGVDTNPVDMA